MILCFEASVKCINLLYADMEVKKSRKNTDTSAFEICMEAYQKGLWWHLKLQQLCRHLSHFQTCLHPAKALRIFPSSFQGLKSSQIIAPYSESSKLLIKSLVAHQIVWVMNVLALWLLAAQKLVTTLFGILFSWLFQASFNSDNHNGNDLGWKKNIPP